MDTTTKEDEDVDLLDVMKDILSKINLAFIHRIRYQEKKCRGGLVGYDAALTQLRSGVRFPPTVFLLRVRDNFSTSGNEWRELLQQILVIINGQLFLATSML